MKALIHAVPCGGAAPELERRFHDAVTALRELPVSSGLQLNGLPRLDPDPLRHRAEFHATLEITGEGAGAEEIDALASALVSHLGPCLERASSTLLVGEDRVFVASDRAPVRYQYLMRRNAHFDHDGYLKRYGEIHSRFGIRTPGILGYVQLHIDPEASRRAAERAGLGVWDFDSVSELHLESVDAFLAEVVRSTVPQDATEDEKVFVDRDRSCAFSSRVDWQE